MVLVVFIKENVSVFAKASTFRFIVAAHCAAWAGCCIVFTWHWPTYGDAGLMHYDAFLIRNGLHTYLDFWDYNLPLAFFPDWVVDHITSDRAQWWRAYDLLISLFSFLAMARITGRKRLIAAIWAATLLLVIHARDGIDQVGERDFVAIPLLLFAVANLLQYESLPAWKQLAAFGFFVGLAVCIKPSFILFFWLIWFTRTRFPLHVGGATWKRMGFSALFASLPILGTAGWLSRNSSLQAYRTLGIELAAYHMSLGRAPLTALLHMAFAPIGVLVAFCIGLLVWLHLVKKETMALEATRRLWLTGAAACATFMSYLVQGRGFPYQRTPFLAFLLLLLGMVFTEQLQKSAPGCGLAVISLLWGAWIVGPASIWKAAHYQNARTEYSGALTRDLAELSSSHGIESLSGKVQCLDSVGGCIGILYDLRLRQTSSLIYDELLFNALTSRVPIEIRSRFFDQIKSSPPYAFIVAPNLFPAGPGNYEKLDRWPEFKHYLDENYELWTQRTMTKPIQAIGRTIIPDGYRIYRLRNRSIPAHI